MVNTFKPEIVDKRIILFLKSTDSVWGLRYRFCHENALYREKPMYQRSFSLRNIEDLSNIKKRTLTERTRGSVRY